MGKKKSVIDKVRKDKSTEAELRRSNAASAAVGSGEQGAALLEGSYGLNP